MKNFAVEKYIICFQTDKCILEVLPKIQSAFDAKKAQTAKFFTLRASLICTLAALS
jgi:hypothetical protein